MQNEFDDHIKKKVDGFKLPPSPQIWELVEAQLPEKRRRRFIIWWWPLLLALAGAGLFVLYNHHTKSTDSAVADKENFYNKKDIINNYSTVKKIDKQPDENNNAGPKPVNRIIKNNNGKLKYTTNENGIKEKNSVEENFQAYLNQYKLNKKNELINTAPVVENNYFKSVDTGTRINKTIAENFGEEKKTDSNLLNKTIDSTVNKLTEKEESKNIKDTSVIKNKKAADKKSAKKNKWELIAGIGKSNTTKMILGAGGSANLDVSNNATVSSPGGGSTNIGILSAPTSGVSFNLELRRTVQLTKKIALFGGVGYNYLSNKQASGALVDSVQTVGVNSGQFSFTSSNSDRVNSYYKYGSTLNHDNYVHVLNASIGLKYCVVKGFALFGGIAGNYQFSSHWLQPDLTKRILYYSDKLTTKWNMGTKIGFEWQFSKPLSVGIFYDYNFTKASLSAVQQNLHWQNFGATFLLELPAKK